MMKWQPLADSSDVPEPNTLALLGIGAVGLGLYRPRQRG